VSLIPGFLLIMLAPGHHCKTPHLLEKENVFTNVIKKKHAEMNSNLSQSQVIVVQNVNFDYVMKYLESRTKIGTKQK